MLIHVAKAMCPKTEVPDKDLENYIFKWERRLEVYLKAMGEPAINAKQHKVNLLNMCSPALLRHLDYREP